MHFLKYPVALPRPQERVRGVNEGTFPHLLLAPSLRSRGRGRAAGGEEGQGRERRGAGVEREGKAGRRESGRGSAGLKVRLERVGVPLGITALALSSQIKFNMPSQRCWKNNRGYEEEKNR
eukprot:Gb_34368 [translate_table: standard]